MKPLKYSILCISEKKNFLNTLKTAEEYNSKKETIDYITLKELRRFSEDYEDPDTVEYRIISVRSYKEALEITNLEKNANREIPLLICDLEQKEKNYIDLKSLKSLMPPLYACFITKNPNIKRANLTSIFDADEWIYIEESTSPYVLIQTIYNILSSFYIKREKAILSYNSATLISTILSIRNFNFMDMDILYTEILKSILNYITAGDGFLIEYNEGEISFCTGMGKFSTPDVLKKFSVDLLIKESIGHQKIIQTPTFLILPIVALDKQYAVLTTCSQINRDFRTLLDALLQSMTVTLDNAALYQNAIKMEKDKRIMTIKTLQKIMSTLSHYINNPLTTIRGYSEASLHTLTDLKKVKKNILIIQEHSEIIQAAVDVLSHIDQKKLTKTIDLPLARLQLIDIEKELNQKKQKIEEKYKKIKEKD